MIKPRPMVPAEEAMRGRLRWFLERFASDYGIDRERTIALATGELVIEIHRCGGRLVPHSFEFDVQFPPARGEKDG
jgi:hypothetical protein